MFIKKPTNRCRRWSSLGCWRTGPPRTCPCWDSCWGAGGAGTGMCTGASCLQWGHSHLVGVTHGSHDWNLVMWHGQHRGTHVFEIHLRLTVIVFLHNTKFTAIVIKMTFAKEYEWVLCNVAVPLEECKCKRSQGLLASFYQTICMHTTIITLTMTFISYIYTLVFLI